MLHGILSATYEQGNLTLGATRGDGYVGENITENIRTIAGLPHHIKNAPKFLEVRGEIYIEKHGIDDNQAIVSLFLKSKEYTSFLREKKLERICL